RDVYSFSLASDSLLYFDSLTNSGALSWSLTGPSGTVASRAFNASDYTGSAFPLLVAPAGSYTLTIDVGGDATPSYSFRLSDLPSATAVTPGTALTGPLADRKGTDLYKLTASPGQAFYFDSQATSGVGTAAWRLFDRFGTQLFLQALSADVDLTTLSLG